MAGSVCSVYQREQACQWGSGRETGLSYRGPASSTATKPMNEMPTYPANLSEARQWPTYGWSLAMT